MRSYKQIAEVTFHHGYYPGGNLDTRDLEIVPTKWCERLLKDYRLTLKATGNKISIKQEFEKEPDSRLPVVEIDSKVKLDFLIRQRNKHFVSMTEMPFISMGREVIYLTNLRKGKVQSGGEMSEGEVVGSEDVFPFFPKAAEKTLEALTGSSFEVESTLAEKVASYQSGDRMEELESRFNTFQNGKYNLKVKIGKEQGVVLHRALTNSSNIGFIELFLDESSKEIVEKNKPFRRYRVSFEARSLPWNYTIFQRNQSLNGLSVIDNHEEQEFQKATEGNHPVRGTAYVTFASTEKLKLTSTPGFEFSLVALNGGGSKKVKLEKLPSPKAHEIIKNDQDQLLFNKIIYL